MKWFVGHAVGRGGFLGSTQVNICFRRSNDVGDASEVSVLIAGTGGLGVVGLTRLVADCLGSRFQCVHTEETRGIAQRRAPVRAIVRAGRVVRSARLPDGLVDVVLAVEAAEALRVASYVAEGTVVVLADLLIPSSGAMSAATSIISVPRVAAALEARGAQVLIVPVTQWLRRESLPDMLTSTAVFGAGSRLLDFSLEETEERLSRLLGKRMWEQNCEAMQMGYAAANAASLQAEARTLAHAQADLERVAA
jgi:Pyruvate/2-oxoacid:ferredoxin oxidoreductase gamma subunit